MNDDELMDELRRTLRSRAEELRPGPAPSVAPGGTRRARRWPALAAAAVLVAAAAGAVAGLELTRPGHSRLTVTSVPGATAPVQTPVTHPAPATTFPPPTAPPTSSMPPGFQPLSVTFVSPDEGWVLGDTGAGTAAVVGRTTDGGSTWSVAPAPPITMPGNAAGAEIRFADPADGWIFLTGDAAQKVLWSTHDGGATWSARGVPGPVEDLEAAGGAVYMVALDPKSGAPGFRIYSAPATSDRWAASATVVPVGAGPVPAARIVLQGGSGWIVENDRIVVAGARLDNGTWAAWAPPCGGAKGSVALAASSASSLVAVCQEGVWGPSDLGPGVTGAWLFGSSNGGQTWKTVGRVGPDAFGASVVTSAPGDPQVVVTGGGSGLQASFDGGRTWQSVYSSGGPSIAEFVGFTTATQGVAVFSGQSSSVMVMTRDGGHSWQPVTFGPG